MLKVLNDVTNPQAFRIPDTEIAAVLANNPVYKDLLPRQQILQSIVGRSSSSWCQCKKVADFCAGQSGTGQHQRCGHEAGTEGRRAGPRRQAG